MSAGVAGYVLVGVLGLGKNAPGYVLASALLGMYIHQRMDAPVAKRLSEAGL
ncbi:hypothetical protein [Jatrophihabitans lederbergiae]|uniref:Uncharacterized protein n=1 Tax=Jatrophihabitans lederbergiae TaxID=3075547 RepID=A0ABU2JEK4_9ACTN|nr:hypothetical protein [Jatrophihabitans sp. DSM 44399]MDT0263433.1 hypothetical protein [Jatrophihabitans sp. DSM 44399]